MSKVKFDKEKLLVKFKTLSVASICIQKTSKYLYQFYKISDTIVNVWLQALNTVNSDAARISLFYIANEMLQSKSYGNSYFKQSWKPHLAHSIDCIKDSSVNDKIRRVLNIWIERKVYEKSYVDDLISRLAPTKTTVLNDERNKEIILNFDPEEVIEKLKELIHVETDTTESLLFHESSINFDEKLCQEEIKKLKDKTHCHKFSEQLDSNINHLFQFCTMLEEELKIRQITLDAMNNAEIYYETQQSETFVVEDAYRRYGNLITKTKDTLEDHLEFLMDDGGPVDLDDAPSPGKTPPHLYEESSKKASNLNDSPMSYGDVGSPSQSMDMSEDDTPKDKSGYLDKPYSPSHEVFSTPVSHPKSTLSSNEALQLLTSVFSQSLTKKPLVDVNTKVNLQPDIFRNTLTTPTKSTTEDTKTNEKEEKSATVFADAFRLISNLTGLKNISERSTKSETPPNTGTTIPILTSKIPFKSDEESNESNQNSFVYNQSNFSTSNIQNGIENSSRVLYPDLSSFPPSMFNNSNNNQSSSVPNPMFSPFNNTQIPPPPISGLYKPASNTTLGYQNNPRSSTSPGSYTDDEDEGGATPTQDEPASFAGAMFNPGGLPGAEVINKQIQDAINSGSNPFNLQGILAASKDNQMWNGQFPFNSHGPPTMNMPFSLMTQNPPIPPQFTPTSSNSMPATFGPPRAIRTKRPIMDSGSSVQDQNADEDNDSASDSLSPPLLGSHTWPQLDKESVQSDNAPEELPPSAKVVTDSNQPDDDDSDDINLYGDVEEELDRNYNFYQQSINVRNSRPPPPMDRYHLYNNSNVPDSHQHPLMATNYHQQHHHPPPALPPALQPHQQYNNSSYYNNNNRPRMMNNVYGFQSRTQFQSRPAGFGGHNNNMMPYYPNRSTNFRPRDNYNMFN